VFYDYLHSGEYQSKDTIPTISNAMDVGDPSNFKRITALYNNNIQEIKSEISSYWVSDDATLRIIKEVFNKHNYILDPHGAVGFEALRNYRTECKYKGKAIFLETAHPGKFADTVKDALNKEIELPGPLTSCLNKRKSAIESPSAYEGFRELLVSNF
jgi:threonine synthase